MSLRTYNPSVRVGNWSEDIQLEEDTLKDFIEKREKGELLIQKSAGLLRTTLADRELTVSRDGYVHFGDKVLIFCNQQVDRKQYSSSFIPRDACVVSLNFGDPSEVLQTKEIKGPCTVTGSSRCSPVMRNVFQIISVDGSAVGEVLQYGQQFMFQSLPEAGGLFMQSDSRTFMVHSKKARHQEVALVKEPSFLAHWEVVYRDPQLRMEMEGSAVKANVEVIIRHSKTGHKLAVEQDHKIRSVYGLEYELSCQQYLDSHKFEKDVNRFVLQMQVPGDEVYPMQEGKPEAQKQ